MTLSSSQIPHIGPTGADTTACHVDVWFLDLDTLSLGASSNDDLLSEDERTRASAFQSERTRRRFAACRAAVRRILASQAAIDPAGIRFRYGRHGRPELEHNAMDVRFSVSHSSGRAAVAVTRQLDLGVDIEVNREIGHLDSLAQRYLAPLEIEQLARADDRVRAFWTAWTRKEAYIKALGTGLSEGLCEFAVSLSHPARLLTTGRLDDDAADWTMLDLSSDVHVVAVAVRARSVSVDLH